MKQYYTYLLASKRNGTLYVGVTSNLRKRVYEHKQGFIQGFADKYNVNQLVWYEIHNSIEEAIKREKRIKRWNRSWKLELVDSTNPFWDDLFEQL